MASERNEQEVYLYDLIINKWHYQLIICIENSCAFSRSSYIVSRIRSRTKVKEIVRVENVLGFLH